MPHRTEPEDLLLETYYDVLGLEHTASTSDSECGSLQQHRGVGRDCHRRPARKFGAPSPKSLAGARHSGTAPPALHNAPLTASP